MALPSEGLRVAEDWAAVSKWYIPIAMIEHFKNCEKKQFHRGSKGIKIEIEHWQLMLGSPSLWRLSTFRDALGHVWLTPMSSTTTRTQPRISFASLTPNNLGTVRKLNSVLFIKYSEKFYKDILSPDLEEFCKLSQSFLSSYSAAHGSFFFAICVHIQYITMISL